MSTVNQLGKYQPYPDYKDSGVEWLGDVPNEWSVIAIKRLSRVKRGASPRPIDDPKFFDDDGTYSWVRISDVTASDVYLYKTEQTLSALGSSLSVKLHPGDLFLSIAATVGKPCIAAIECCIHDGFVFFPDLKISTKFLYYLFSAGEAYKGLGKMGTQLNLNTDTVGDIKIGVGTNVEVENIVSFLDYETARIDQLIAKQQQLIELLKEKRQAVISHAVTKGLNPNAPMKDSGVEWLGQVPEHWEVKRLRHLGKVIGGYAFKSSDFTELGYPVIKISNVSHLCFDWGDSSYLPEHFATLQKEYLAPKGSLIFAMTRPVISGGIKVAQLESDLCPLVNQRVGFMMFNRPELARYVLMSTQSSPFLAQFTNNMTVTNQPNISSEGIESIALPVPPDGELKVILNQLEQLLGTYEKTLKKTGQQIALLQERRTALISAAVTGKIDLRGWQPPQREVAA